MKPNFELLKDAYEIIDGIPFKNFNLDTWRKRDDGATCGTIACAAGWLTLHPKFKELGLKTEVGSGKFQHRPVFNGKENMDALADLFGIELSDALQLFREKRQFEQGTHKQVFLWRLRSFLEAHGQLKEQLAEANHAAA
ncbi:hypothetical protein WK03_35250 [Burkholderia cepacia]|uniref:hypothetical protein n=1 Tax=Burkholderia cepacia TaxID=292 RepID=UPI000752A74A|nr:hypothetical protein [Burkholderia cepacia]KVQ35727.1 hypothetical protein WK03_35250 [Burkholderia cepacia]